MHGCPLHLTLQKEIAIDLNISCVASFANGYCSRVGGGGGARGLAKLCTCLMYYSFACYQIYIYLIHEVINSLLLHIVFMVKAAHIFHIQYSLN